MADLLTIRAADIIAGDVVHGYFQPGVTVETAAWPPTRDTDRQLRPSGLALPVLVTRNGEGIELAGSGRRLADDDPVLVLRSS